VTVSGTNFPGFRHGKLDQFALKQSLEKGVEDSANPMGLTSIQNNRGSLFLRTKRGGRSLTSDNQQEELSGREAAGGGISPPPTIAK